MSCNTCTPVKNLTICTSVITVGTCSVIAGDVTLYMKNHTTGRLESKDFTTDGSGTIAGDLNAYFNLMSGHDYEVWATASGSDMEDRLDLTIQGATATVTCFSVKFDRRYVQDVITPIATQTVSF